MSSITDDNSVSGKSSPDMSFGEPLHVSVARGVSKFQSIQRAYSRPLTVAEEEEMMAGKGSAFDLTTWLTGRQQQQGPPFAKQVGLVFNELSVYGDPVRDRHIATVATPFWKLAKFAMHGFGIPKLLSKSSDTHRLLLSNMTGVVEDGEMLLVLGRPGAGCSTLLRVLGNHRNMYHRIDGMVSYGGLTPEQVNKAYRGEVAYCSEEDYHHPTLTVRQTLDFAIQCKMPSSRMLKDRSGYKAEFLDTLLEMFGLTNCADTIVGNAFLRGVSGGERKRVSIAEQVASGASVDVWDGSTRGLDSSSALDYVRSLRVMTDVLHKATVVSVYQASEDIYELFDKVMVVDEGRQLYFGPASGAVAYFESLGIQKPPRQTSADFLTGVTQLDERRIVPGFEHNAPCSAEDFERMWVASVQHNAVRDQASKFEQQVQSDKRGHAVREFVDQTKMGGSTAISRRSPYSTTILHQLRCLLFREIGMLWGNKFDFIIKALYTAVFAIAGATIFLQLPTTSDGALARGGCLFYALLFQILCEEGQSTKAFVGKLVDIKHQRLALAHPAALSIAQVLTELPTLAATGLVFSLIYYFTAGLASSGGQFFAFYLFLLVATLCLSTLFRLIGSIVSSVDAAHTLAGCTIVVLMTHTGFLIPVDSMRPYFRWIRYINPLAYAWSALMSNEFRNLELECAGASLVPSGPGFEDIAHQVCTLQGARAGSRAVQGADYIETAYQIKVSGQWTQFGAVIGFWILFVILRALAMEFIHFGSKGYTTTVSKRQKTKIAPETKDQMSMDEKKPAFLDQSPDEQIRTGTTFTWKDLNYSVPVKGESRQLLNKVSGFIKPGQMTALMGSSGAGKTTLLDSLSQRKTIGTLEGQVLMNGAELARSFRRSTGYAEQLDVHAPLVTVREALRFSAYLRQEASVPDAEKDEYVERVIYLLGMSEIADCMVGDPETGEGISLEERKRLTIGVELVSKPKILFLDEPTSGLDAQASFKIVQLLRHLAAEGQPILCTIHQPSSILFEAFDRILLLARGGHTVYHGDIGDDASTLISYFERNGATKCPPSANPAEYILDVVGKSGSAINWPHVWQDSRERQSVLTEVDRINQIKRGVGGSAGDSRLYARSQWYQTKLVTRRMFRMQWRNLGGETQRYFMQAFAALFCGFVFFSLDHSVQSTFNVLYAIFVAVVVGAIIVFQAAPHFIKQRLYFGRESSTSQYGWLAWATAIVVSEWPATVVSQTLFFVCFNWTVGLNGTSNSTGMYYILHIVHGLFSQTLGQAIAAFSPNDYLASTLAPIATTSFVLGSGVVAAYSSMPSGWHWLYELSPYHLYVESAVVNDLHNAVVECKPNEFSVFDPPANSTCMEYAGEWVRQTTGYLLNPSDTKECSYCQFKSGSEFYETFSWSYGRRWQNFGILVAFVVFNVMFILCMVRVYKVNKR
ncbi:ATP-binding cassette transporter snq2 [Coemansia sp. RSA 2131]|nr:ATP-binding cassette transporter snq2 [Coemansia sp. RSA 2131]